jgi:hypothetical protein
MVNKILAHLEPIWLGLSPTWDLLVRTQLLLKYLLFAMAWFSA